MKDSFVNNLFDLIINNKKIKEKELCSINNFQKLYNIINNYEPQTYTYDEIITNSDKRLEFLVNAVKIAISSKNMDQDSIDIILQMYEDIYNYLFEESELKEIEIPSSIKENLFNRMFIPNHSQLLFVTTLLVENKRIYDTEFNNKDFSQTIKQGLHKDITEVLNIKRDNLSHLLGLTNDGSLYEFYRKTFINSKIFEILNSLGVQDVSDENFNIDEFDEKFKKYFGLNYNQDNYIKLINWKYDASDDYLQKRGIVVTESEREILNKTCDYTPKSKTVDFYCNKTAIDLLIKENTKVSNFIYEYIRNKIIENKNLKKESNELKKMFSEEELNKLFDESIKSNEKEIQEMITKYVEQKKYKFEDEKDFKDSFINTFGYSYPLINYKVPFNELISKNISFYNFSLFKNLNSIIVDYSSPEKKIKSDVFLVSYAKKKIKSISKKVKEIIVFKDKKYEEAVENNSNKDDLDSNYIMNLKSILSFPVEERYYFRFGFTSNDKRKQDDKIIKENTNPASNITLIGFKNESIEEANRIRSMESGEMTGFKHFLSCETNISSNYHQYITDYTRRGIEYPINVIVEGDNKKIFKGFTKIIKMSGPLDQLDYYTRIFNDFNYENNINNEQSIGYEKWLIKKISNSLYEYKTLKEIEIKIMQYKLETNKINKKDINIYKLNIDNEIKNLKDINLYYDNINNYFSEYEDYIDAKIKINNIDIENKKNR